MHNPGDVVVASRGHEAARLAGDLEDERRTWREPAPPVFNRPRELALERRPERLWSIGQRLNAEIAQRRFVTANSAPGVHPVAQNKNGTIRLVVRA
jgi:hypothetical protein